ncbi:hypothetical protein HPB50_014390 [Hyalomma asiaticum]|uniref:Uncharacterized protein n=1 Tax=Hyalomma asiaticum TaxID=266040 RepID=A0ACB7SFG9_HYAAI|nr:hypothetical protein HPB50_014390 [Hyalomma asiaticum]
MEKEAVMSETTGQAGAGGHERANLVAGDKSFMMRDGAVCGDIAEINKPCVELPGEATERAVPVITAEQGTSPDGPAVVVSGNLHQISSSLADDSSYQAVDGYYSHKFLQDLLARMASEPHPLSNEAQEVKREPLDPALVEAYTVHATRVYETYLRHIDELGGTVAKRLEEVRGKALDLDLARRIQVLLYSDTVEAAVSHLRRVAMTWGSLVLLDITEPSRTVPQGLSEQYLFCRIVSACLKLRDTWWRSEFYLAKYFLRFLNRCLGLSDDWQSRLQEANVSVLRASIEAHERMDREIGLWQWARSLRFPSEHRPEALQPNLLSVFVDEQLTGDVSSLMTLFVFETGNTVYRAIFSIKKEFERRQLSYDSGELEAEVRGTWAAYLESVHEQCASLGANRALYSTSMHQGEDAARIGDGARFYMDMVTPLHKAVTHEWSKTYGALIDQLTQCAQAEPERKADLEQVSAWVEETGRQVLVAMETAFGAFENQVRVITKNVELFSTQIRKILE